MSACSKLLCLYTKDKIIRGKVPFMVSYTPRHISTTAQHSRMPLRKGIKLARLEKKVMSFAGWIKITHTPTFRDTSLSALRSV